MPSTFRGHLTLEYVACSTTITYLGEQLVMLSIFGDIWIDCTYIHTSDWSGSCSEEGPLFEKAPPRSLYVDHYRRQATGDRRQATGRFTVHSQKFTHTPNAGGAR